MKIAFRRVAATAAGLLIVGSVAMAIPAQAESTEVSPVPAPPAPSEQAARQLLVEGGIPAADLPADTVEWLASKIDAGTTVGSTSSSQYSNQDTTMLPGTVSTLGYEAAPCYLTVITEYNFASPKWVDNDSVTGCTVGLASTVRHDMELIKRDTIFGTTSIVASGGASGGPGGYSSYARYSCPNSNNSDFQGDTAGEIYYGSNYYYAEATSGGYDNYNCG